MKKVQKVEDREFSDTDESVGKVMVMTVAGIAGGENRIQTKLGVRGPDATIRRQQINFLTDTGVRKTIMNSKDWRKISKGCKLTTTKLRFRPYGTEHYLPVIGSANVFLKAQNGTEIETYVYVNEDEKEESLLGEKDAQRLGIIQIKAGGAEQEVFGILRVKN